MKYAIIGTGAVGGYYGGRLANAGHDVHFLLHSDYAHVRKYGLQVESCNGSFHLPRPNIYNSVQDMPQADVVIVALKTTRNSLLSQLLPPLLHPKTLVLLIQNGIGLEADVQKMFAYSDVYVMPSVSEPFGISPLEAMKTNVPTIISKQSGVAEVLDYAIKVNFWDIDAMADAMYALLEYPALSEMAARCGTDEVNNLKWDNAATKIKDVYQLAINMYK